MNNQFLIRLSNAFLCMLGLFVVLDLACGPMSKWFGHPRSIEMTSVYSTRDAAIEMPKRLPVQVKIMCSILWNTRICKDTAFGSMDDATGWIYRYGEVQPDSASASTSIYSKDGVTTYDIHSYTRFTISKVKK